MSLTNTSYTPSEIRARLGGKKRLFFIGIGGIHMSSLALWSRERGFWVSGSDSAANENTERLRREGVEVFSGHDAANLADAEAAIYTLAIGEDNPEYREAKRRGLPLFSRADYLGYLMSEYPVRVGVAGSHGKSTTTAMLAQILEAAGRAPRVICGAAMPHFGAPLALGRGECVVFEACEYANSFLRFSPTLAVVLNAELDHVDFFPDEAALLDAFGGFVRRAGQAILPSGNGALLAAANEGARATFGLDRTADYRAENLTLEGGLAHFDLCFPHGCVGRLALQVPGEHNAKNALAAAAAADRLGVPTPDIIGALAAFRGISRRMEYRGTLRGARVFDDYAHHPTEIAATLKTARTLAPNGRLFAAFQSHTYSRTAAFFEEICHALRAADRVLVADIYAARESKTLGMSAAHLAKGIGPTATAGGTLAEMARTLEKEVREGDAVVVMGAGDIARIFAEFSQKHFTL